MKSPRLLPVTRLSLKGCNMLQVWAIHQSGEHILKSMLDSLDIQYSLFVVTEALVSAQDNRFEKYIYLMRNDTIAQAVACYLAYTNDDSIKRNVKSVTPIPHYDGYAITEWHDKILTADASINSMFDADEIEPHVVSYEDMLRETINVMRRIADYLGITNYTYTPPTIGAQSSKVQHDYIRRYKAELRTGDNVY